MSKAQLTLPARRALLALLAINIDDATNNALDEQCGIKIDAPTRALLIKLNLLTAEKRKGAFYHTLTVDGRDRAEMELSTAAPDKGSRLFYRYVNALSKVMADCHLKPAEIFGAESISPPSNQAKQPAAVEVRLADGDIESQVLAAYERLARRRADQLSLVKLRGKLSHVQRDDLDRVLKAMDRRRVIQLDPDPNRKALPAEAHAAAITIGGEDKHFISVGHR